MSANRTDLWKAEKVSNQSAIRPTSVPAWKKRAAERKKLSRFPFFYPMERFLFSPFSRFKELSCVPFLRFFARPFIFTSVTLVCTDHNEDVFVPVDEERKETRHWGLETNYHFGDKAAEKKNSTFSLLPRREGKKMKGILYVSTFESG